jgi:hypothetical protein
VVTRARAAAVRKLGDSANVLVNSLVVEAGLAILEKGAISPTA